MFLFLLFCALDVPVVYKKDANIRWVVESELMTAFSSKVLGAIAMLEYTKPQIWQHRGSYNSLLCIASSSIIDKLIKYLHSDEEDTVNVTRLFSVRNILRISLSMTGMRALLTSPLIQPKRI